MRKQFYISLLLLSSAFISSAQIYTPGGTIQGSSGGNSVGIGVSSPLRQLTLYGSEASVTPRLLLQSASTTNPSGSAIDWWCSTDGSYGSDPTARISAFRVNSGALGGLQFATRGLNSSLVNIMYLTAAWGGSAYSHGRVGINTTEPQSALHVSSENTTALRIGVTGTNNYQLLVGVSTANSYSEIQSSKQGVGYSTLMLNRQGGNVIVGSGKVSLGTNSVTEKLTLYNADATQVATQYGNSNTDIGSGNGFLIGIESSGNGFVWNREDNFIRFGTNGSERIRITSDGKIAIGTITPTSNRFDVHDDNSEIYSSTQIYTDNKTIVINNTNNTTNNFTSLCLFSGSTYRGGTKLVSINTGGPQNTDSEFAILVRNTDTNFHERLRIKGNGNVGIGTNTPSYKLDVCGTIRAKELKVDLEAGCDFVFSSDYRLMNLNELEKFVKTNKHLPEIAPEKEMIEHGVNMKEMQMKLLQKIEELTLYTIELNKQLENLQGRLSEVEQNR